MPEENEQSYKEKRIRSITRIYYSKPEVQKALVDFAQSREVVPRYFEAFGKRPDVLQYASDISASVTRGATSFHSSQEIWRDPLQLGTHLSANEVNTLREGWDLLIDIDSPFLDYSQFAAKLVCAVLEKYGITHYGMKFSGSKGFHIIVPRSAFPQEFEGHPTKDLFPDLARIITEFILDAIKTPYNQHIAQSDINFEAVKQRTKLSKEDLVEIQCPNCKSSAKKQQTSTYQCDVCRTTIERKGPPSNKKKLQCTDQRCPGTLNLVETREYYFCENCKLSDREWNDTSKHKVVYVTKSAPATGEFKEEISGEKLGSLDLVLVSPRHLFRMPYSLHEKTGLASVVVSKRELDSFSPKDADPMKVVVKEFYPNATEGEAELLMNAALAWKRRTKLNPLTPKKNFEVSKEFTEVELKDVPEEAYPDSIKKLLEGLSDGRKRGLFVLLTFLRCVGKTPEEITEKVTKWNEVNNPPLKEGYVKSQLEWHFKQSRKILPPNYANGSFYKDLNLITELPDAKNPLVEVKRALKKSSR